VRGRGVVATVLGIVAVGLGVAALFGVSKAADTAKEMIEDVERKIKDAIETLSESIDDVVEDIRASVAAFKLQFQAWLDQMFGFVDTEGRQITGFFDDFRTISDSFNQSFSGVTGVIGQYDPDIEKYVGLTGEISRMFQNPLEGLI